LTAKRNTCLPVQWPTATGTDSSSSYYYYLILHSLICRVLLLLLCNASDLRNCTSYFGACMWVWYCRPPIGAHFHPTPQPPPVPQQLGEKDGSPLRGVARLCRGRQPPLGDRTRLVIIIKNECHSNIIVDRLQGCNMYLNGTNQQATCMGNCIGLMTLR